MKESQEAVMEMRRTILEMIHASWELARRLGSHQLKNGCNCIACVNKRKRIIDEQGGEWKFEL
ncbi:MAG: hypothetical protein PVG26_09775 [Desulfobacterales bacterium]|jgi:hypothetical protein